MRNHRTRRMLLAIQRGFNGMLPWSPLAFAVVITSLLLPQVVWARAVPYALVTTALFITIGWALDTIFKPRIKGRPRPVATRDYGTWSAVLPLLVLLALILGLALGVHFATGLRITTVILIVVPAIAVIWFAVQAPAGDHIHSAARRSVTMVRHDLPQYRDEFIMMGMSGFIGTMGAALLTPAIQASGLTLAALCMDSHAASSSRYFS